MAKKRPTPKPKKKSPIKLPKTPPGGKGGKGKTPVGSPFAKIPHPQGPLKVIPDPKAKRIRPAPPLNVLERRQAELDKERRARNPWITSNSKKKPVPKKRKKK